MKTYIIEARVTKIKITTVKAETRKEAIKIAETYSNGLKWEQTHAPKIQLVSIA
jgi:hypothetical protein